MPIYEYQCKECGNKFEELIASSTSPQPPCPTCASGETEKLMSTPGNVGIAGSSLPACPSAKACASNGPCCGGSSCPIN